MEPAPYPPKNTEEIKAVVTFLGLLDIERIKPDAKFLDKVPNLDGSVELVDAEQRPVGELKIQIKKIPDGSLQFDCPIELVAYSTRVSSPFVLVCVDVGNRKAYWRHLSLVMPGLKQEQKTFTVRFQPVVDEIGPGFSYFERWRALCDNYLKRISEFPKLEQILEEEIGLNSLAPEDRQKFQQFIDEINVLLDVDVPVVKHEFFADAWKLGASIHRADEHEVYYTIYTVPNGENAPLLTHKKHEVEKPSFVPSDTTVFAWNLEGELGTTVSTRWSTRNFFGEPVKEARKFVLSYLLKLLREKKLHVHGRHQSVELLMWFARNYAHTLGLQVAETYRVDELAYGLKVFLPVWYSLAWPRTIRHFQEQYGEMLLHNPHPSFEQIARSKPQPEHPTKEDVQGAIASHLRSPPLFVRTDTFFFQALFQAVDFLVASSVDVIHRPDRPMNGQGGWVWDCYSPEDFKHNVLSMLNGAAEDYAEFVKGNRFGRLDSSLVSRDEALVFATDSRKWEDPEYRRQVKGYWVDNSDRGLPLMTFIDLAEEPDGFVREVGNGLGTVLVRGVKRKWTASYWPISEAFNKECRTQAMLYHLLKIDLERRFGEWFPV